MPSHTSNGSRIAPIPRDAATGFSNASTVLREDRSLAEPTLPVSAFRLGLAERYKGFASTTNLEAAVPPEPDQKQGRKLKEVSKNTRSSNKHGRKTESTKSHQEERKSKSASKTSRKKKTDGDEKQVKIKEAKITKPGKERSKREVNDASKDGKQKRVKKSSTMSVLLDDAGNRSIPEKTEGMALSRAVKRRRDWTPTRDVKRKSIVVEHSSNAREDHFRNTAGSTVLAQSLKDYGFTMPKDFKHFDSELVRQTENNPVVSKKRIQLVNGLSHPPVIAEKPRRARSPTKKAQTITEKATAPFVALQDEKEPSLLQLLAPPKVSENEAQVSTTGPKRRSKSTSNRSKGKAQDIVPVLLSPKSAMKQVKEQELIFGTSSQLARDESPTFLKDLHQAMKESEHMPILQIPEAAEQEDVDPPTNSRQQSGTLASKVTKNLWAASARDSDNSLLEVETVGFANRESRSMQRRVNDRHQTIQIAPENDSFQDIDVISTSPRSKPDPTSDISEYTELHKKANNDIDMRGTTWDAKVPSTEGHKLKSISEKKKSDEKSTATDAMPNFQGYTEGELRKQISSYGFKSLKKREAMITLLRDCWKSQRNMKLQNLPNGINQAPKAIVELAQEASVDTFDPVKRKGWPSKFAALPTTANGNLSSPPKKARGRPKKSASTTASPAKPKGGVSKRRKNSPSVEQIHAEDENEDEEDARVASSGRPPSRQKAARKDAKRSGEDEQERERLLETITKAVKTYPPTNDPTKLTWYEKILIYDPIIIEDLRMWLNNEGLVRVGEDDEVDDFLVKAWCEGRSVCCVWRDTHRGGQRVRY
ncbi:uncharacterized protein KY384_001401 [Bacidia gigantensis]|uniref:uncharacterized protein n=1 Tax=Bacidia gigantensis TaxID=2732470 RepID=UPI001D037673|nr:uncharacterized protein KY384_001401 [Bacidia gigantensis]KAG8533660.1 hypothetical protein KY384_001401 [Bacidia gigantensis]